MTVLDDPSAALYPLAIDADGKDDVFVGRLRRDPGHERALDMWIVSDNLRKGAATNAIQLAELLHERGLRARCRRAAPAPGSERSRARRRPAGVGRLGSREESTLRSKCLPMVSSEVQRTLVKSPPGAVVGAERPGLPGAPSWPSSARSGSSLPWPNSAVEWEGDEVTGSALIKQAGWGTKVTLTVTLANTRARPPPPSRRRRSAARRGVDHPAHGRRAARDRRAPITSTGDRARLSIPALSAAAPGARAADRDRDDRADPGTAPCRTRPIRRRTTPPRCPTPRPPRCLTRPPPARRRGPHLRGRRAPRRGFFARLFGRRSRRREEPVPPRGAPPRHRPRARRGARHAGHRPGSTAGPLRRAACGRAERSGGHEPRPTPQRAATRAAGAAGSARARRPTRDHPAGPRERAAVGRGGPGGTSRRGPPRIRSRRSSPGPRPARGSPPPALLAGLAKPAARA